MQSLIIFEMLLKIGEIESFLKLFENLQFGLATVEATKGKKLFVDGEGVLSLNDLEQGSSSSELFGTA